MRLTKLACLMAFLLGASNPGALGQDLYSGGVVETPGFQPEASSGFPLDASPGIPLETSPGFPLETSPGFPLETSPGFPPVATPGLTPVGPAPGGHCAGCGSASCGCDVAPACGCDGPCDGFSCESSGILGDGLGCELGDPLTLFGHCGNFSMGGWAQLGYHNRNLQLFNNRKNEYQLHQAWLYAEKTLDTSCGCDVGGRIDYLYGTDAQNTQAFGIPNSHWDNSWDNGSQANGYGHALPQLYVEAGYGDFSIKAGKFFTIIGYEVVPAPDNFFYSHAYTFNYSEPFTHTGALVTYQMNEDVEVYGGYVLGWDSGYEDNGDAYLGGARITLTEDITVTSTTVAGRLNEKAFRVGNINLAETGWMHSTVAEVKLTDRLDYVFQSDWLETDSDSPLLALANAVGVRKTFALNQYLFYTFNDCLGLGARFEWWNVDRDQPATFGFPVEANFYTLTLGANIKPHANIVIRPEIRWDWQDPSILLEDSPVEFPFDGRQTTFGIDSIFLF